MEIDRLLNYRTQTGNKKEFIEMMISNRIDFYLGDKDGAAVSSKNFSNLADDILAWAEELKNRPDMIEFCEDSGCINFNGVKCDHGGKNPILCNRTAKEFHNWLKENGFEIVKYEKEMKKN